MITYGSTTLTSYNTITNIEVYYYKSTSATSLSGGSWSTTKPTWENGKYIWQKIRTTYEGKLENGLYYSESDPVNITGQQGATGTAAYSYKLNASDTTITVSKTGVYSTNKITFIATSKQGTGSVNAYAGRFKIETTVNGTTWTTSYTSSGNESSKEFTIPTGIIAIRCSLYQANGTTTLLDIMTIPILSDDRSIATKTYSGLIGSANDAANASFYFAKIHPDNYTTNYKVKMKVRVTAPEAYAETIDIQFGGYGNTFSSFDAYTTRTGSVGVYYINLYRATQAGISTNHKGHALGIGLRSSTNPTSTSYKRTIIVDILELDGCTVEMLDTAVKYANIDGTGSTNYYGLTEMAVGTAGQNATNNTNTHYTQYSNNVKAGTNGIKGYTLIMKDSENTWSCFYSGAYKKENTGKVAYTGGFMLGKILYSAGAGAQTSDSSLDTYYNYKSGVNTSTIYDAYPVDLRYSTNCASTLTSQRPVYIVGTIENDGLFHLDVSQWYTQTEPTYADGKVYVYVGMAYSTYQVWLSTENPAYMFYNGEFILYDKAQTLQNINTLKNSLETQIDNKVETWCQTTNPANSWSAEERPNHTGDLWYYIGESGTTYKNNTTYQYNGETNVWSAYSANPDLFDKIDGKTAIYYGTTSSITSAEEGDYLVDSENDCTYRWNDGAWVLATDYKQVAIDAIEIGGRNLIRNTADWKNCPYVGDTATVNGEEFIAPTTTGTNWRRINGWFTKTKEDVYFSPIIISFDVKKSDETPLSELVFQLFTTSKAYKEQTSGKLPEGSRYYINLANSIWKNTENVNKDTWTRVYSIPIIMQERFNTTSYTEYDYLAFYIGVKAATSSASFRHLKIELGNKATDWTPAPEDITRGTGFYAITTAPTAYTTKVGEFTPSYRVALSTVKSESGLEEVMVGDVIQQGYNTYPVGYVDASYVYLGMANSIRGASGTPGLNTARVILYRRFASAPTGTNVAPTGDVTYTFSTGIAANNLNSWTQAIPSGTDPVYMIVASASSTGTTDTIPKTEWSAPVKILENGTNGTDGYNQATIYLYQRKSGTAPSKPSSAVEYTFSTGALKTTPTGWSRTIPANDGNPCYVTTAVAFAKTATYSIPASGWSDVVILSQDGVDGVSVTNVTSTNNTADGGTSVVTITLSDGTTKTFNVKNGTKGNTGATAQWYYGTSLTHTSGTATLVATSTSGAVIGSMYLNTQTSLVYKCTAVGTNNTWTYAGDLTTGVIDNIEIGGRNLFGIGSDCATSLTGLTAQNFSIVTEDGYKCAHATGALGTTAHLTSKIPFTPKPLEKMVFSADIKIKDIVLGTTNPMCEFYFSGQTINGTWRSQKVSSTYVDGELVTTGNSKFHLILPSNEWHRVTVKWQFYDAEFTANMPPAIYFRDCTGEIFVKNIKYERGTQETDWTPAPEDAQADIDTALAQSVEYIIGTQTATTGTWTGNTIDKELKVGKTIAYKLPYDGSGNANLILTLADGSVTNAIPVYLNNVRVTTHFKKDCIINMTYDGTAWRASSIPNSDTYNKTLYSQNVKASTATYTGTHIICGTSEGYCNIAPNVTFDLSYPLLYYATAATTTITTTANNHYLNIPGINFSINGTIENGVAYKQIYLKGTVFNNMFTIASSPFLTTKEPSNNDGYYYIPLGVMSSATVGRFVSSNMLYAYIDGAFQPVDIGAVLRAQDAKDLATAVYGTCSTGATTVDKVVTCSNFTLFDGARIQITFTNANTAIASEATTTSPTLNVNGTGRKPIKIGIEEANTANPLYWAAGATIEFVYDGSAWVLQNAPYTLYGTCNTEENVREKQVVCDGAVICKGTTIYVDMLYSNTADSNSENGNVTLNVANTIAKTIYANNATLTIRSRYNWNAGENPSFTFDGQYWQMDKDTVPAYITDKDEDGIFVHPINDTTSGWSIGKVFELLNNGYSYIKMWLEDVTDNLSAKIRIGREDQHHILLDKEIIQFKKGNTPEELASFSSSGISFDDGVPFKIGNDSTYVQFVDNNSDGVADALEIVADKISFKNGGDNTVQDIQERFNDLQTDISNITNNIEINPTANTPYVAITTQKDEYNAGLKLEPTQLSFQLNGQTTATIANDEMNIPTASVTNLFMQSANQSYEKIWVMRSNGHLSLKVGKQN